MFKVTVTHEDGRTHEYEDVIGIDFIDKEFCEQVANRELTASELNYIDNVIDCCEALPDHFDLKQIIEKMDNEELED